MRVLNSRCCDRLPVANHGVFPNHPIWVKVRPENSREFCPLQGLPLRFSGMFCGLASTGSSSNCQIFRGDVRRWGKRSQKCLLRVSFLEGAAIRKFSGANVASFCGGRFAFLDYREPFETSAEVLLRWLRGVFFCAGSFCIVGSFAAGSEYSH